MAATVVRIADVVTAKRTPLDGDLDGIVGRGKSLGNTVYVAIAGTGLAAAVLDGVFFTSNDTSTTDPGGPNNSDPTIKVWGASPDGQGTIVQLDANLQVLLEAVSWPLPEMGIPRKSVGGTTAYARGSDPKIASVANDSLMKGLVLVLRVGAAGADTAATTLHEYPILEALTTLGAMAREFQGPDEIAKSPEFQLGSYFFCSADDTPKNPIAEFWTVDVNALPYLWALCGRATNKVGLLFAAAVGFTWAPSQRPQSSAQAVTPSPCPKARETTWRCCIQSTG